MVPYMAYLRHYSASSPAMEHYGSIPRERRAEPFVKWAGGKKRLLPALDPLFPAHFEAYHEPFLGGGAVYFFLKHVGRVRQAILSDVNEELIRLYRVIRDDVERLVAELRTYPYEAEFYYALRERSPEALSSVARAARMLYLNRTCYNGLYRVNSRGRFNVPIGRYERPVICNETNLRNVHRTLQGAELQRWSFETVLEVSQPGDFVYLDPPRLPLGVPAWAAQRGSELFKPTDEGRLFEVFRLLDKRGCLVMLSRVNSAQTRQAYQAFDIREINRPRNGQSAGRRRRTRELVIRNFA